MNAPADQLPAAWARYLPTVAALCPSADPEQLELRARLMLLIDLAGQDLQQCTWESGQALTAIEAIAFAHRLTPMSTDMLKAMRLALLKFYRAARELERVFAPPCAE